jgi:hypothetical protein
LPLFAFSTFRFSRHNSPKKTKAKFLGAVKNFAPTHKHIFLGERKGASVWDLPFGREAFRLETPLF